ncbi:GTPase HflX [Candidatus Riflebacteria bacterium]
MEKRKRFYSTRKRQQEFAVLLGVNRSKKKYSEDYDFLDSFKELHALVCAAGGIPSLDFVQNLPHPHPKYYLGKGKLEEVAGIVQANNLDMCVVDDELSPNQHRTLSQVLGIKVIDRTHLILDIFAARAHSHLGKVQVELAQLKYLFPRLIGMWTHFEKQEGAIGTRGPGETQLETDKRLLRKRILFLEKQLEKISVQHAEQRKQRQKTFQPLFSLVGYTNAGKTSILNFLAGQSLKEDDAVFTTLDATSRKVKLSNHKEVIVSDTVGFIQRIPHTLITSFKTTLEEVILADCLLHVIDVSDARLEEKMDTVEQTLKEIMASGIKVPILHVFNKVDLWTNRSEEFALSHLHAPAVFVSCKHGSGREEMLIAIEEMVQKTMQCFTFKLPVHEEKLVHELYEYGMVETRRIVDESIVISAHVGERLFKKFQKFQVDEY